MGAGSPGTRKEAGERDTGASDRRCGEEVTGVGPSCDLVVCVWEPSVTGFFSFFSSLLRWGLSRPPGAHKLLLHAADEGASAGSQSGPELQGGPGNLPPSVESQTCPPGGAGAHAALSALLQSFLYVVDSLNIPTPDSQYLLDLVRHRHWGESVLMVDV